MEGGESAPQAREGAEGGGGAKRIAAGARARACRLLPHAGMLARVRRRRGQSLASPSAPHGGVNILCFFRPENPSLPGARGALRARDFPRALDGNTRGRAVAKRGGELARRGGELALAASPRPQPPPWLAARSQPPPCVPLPPPLPFQRVLLPPRVAQKEKADAASFNRRPSLFF